MDKNDKIKRKFNEIGFDLIGFTEPVIKQKFITDFQKRVNENDLPPFVHSDTESILNPKKLHPWVETVVVVGMSYAQNDNCNADGFISRYTRGDEYHLVMEDKIKKGIEYLNQLYNSLKTSYYIDNGPVLEKVLAQQAGLGWIGKNTLLINQKYGSYIFLGEIFINKKLKFDEIAEDKCGNCKKCIENCPTNSLSTPYYLNYRTCRSNLTQIKGRIDDKQAKLIDNCIWGCDQCQVVCPYNIEVPKDIHPEFKPKIRGDIVEILNYNRKEFPTKWLNTALSWRGMRIIQRNALIAISNLGVKKEKYREVILKKIKDPSPIIRYYAYKAYIDLGYDLNLIKDEIQKEKETEINKLIKGK